MHLIARSAFSGFLESKPLQVGVRNAVAEVRRFSTVQEWRHVATNNNVADSRMRPAAVAEILPGCAWQEGYEWMTLPVEEMPLQTAEQITLSAEERRQAAAEVRGGDIRGHAINTLVTDVADCYAYSKYLVDPCRLGRSKSLRVLALVRRFITRCREGGRRRGTAKVDPASAAIFDQEELKIAADNFFCLGTREFKKYNKLSEIKHCSVEKNLILYFIGRLLDISSLVATEKVLFDIDPVSFVKPILDKFSPIAYALMIETLWKTAVHRSPLTTYRFSLETAYVVGGKALAQEIRDSCPYCKRPRRGSLRWRWGRSRRRGSTSPPPSPMCRWICSGPTPPSASTSTAALSRFCVWHLSVRRRGLSPSM